ncbi:MAG: UDP-N-acetylglucosamine 2-epimerase (non-hydrolyzing) [Candidatus Electrothrix sp. AR4]|nr:UDP-N-acetylglucosamine 2-epimerase (non-hydrolyzing) [Candidatus Electrothrix sp. AR4]
MRIVTVIGARPQFIKAATISRAIDNYNQVHPKENIEESIVHTGQHFDSNMSRIFFDQMRIPEPFCNLNISNLSHGAMTGNMLEQIEKILLKKKPDLVLVYGDTNSTLAGALAAKKLHIKLAHVEAGLRSFNMNMPEEINRILTDRISDYLFCPTLQAVSNLEKEGYENFGSRIFNSGDVMFDAVCYYQQFATPPQVLNQNRNTLAHGFILATIHRAENTDIPQKMATIFESLNQISYEIPVIFPVHPRTRQIINNLKLETKSNALFLIDPVGYFEIMSLLDKCSLVMTDSGGMQKEAYFFKKPCLTLREQTEWVELLDAGVNQLVTIDRGSIISHFKQMINSELDFSDNLYGNGSASIDILTNLLA